MKKVFSAILVIAFCFCIKAQKVPNDSLIILNRSLKQSISLGLNFLESTQRKVTIPLDSYKGEWQTYMCMQRWFILLGKRKKVEDSNCFSVASVHNALAEIYLAYPEYTSISKMLDSSFERIMQYKDTNKFNFWNRLPPNRKLTKNDIIGHQPLVRRPTHYKLRSRYINNAANVVDDSDDAALGYTAISLRQLINLKHSKADTLNNRKYEIGPLFDKYRDMNRNNRHWYNYLFGHDKETGSYLTWQAPEYQFKHWNIIKVLGHNCTFFLPFSECCPHAYKPYLPYGSNDVDGVVNANVLTALCLHSELNSQGAESAIRYIEKKCKKKKFDRVGIYYPNRYQFAFTVAHAYSVGVSQLKKSTEYLLPYLLGTQDKDGGWSSRRVVNKHDRLQSTVYALNALIDMGNEDQNKTKESIQKAIRFIMNNAIRDESGMHWKGGVFFSGGTVVRNCLVWKSDAYTTAIILNAFSKYRKYMESDYIFGS